MAAVLLVVSALATIVTTAVAAASNPPKGIFIYTILRDGSPVGQQRIEFVGDGQKLRVLGHTKLDVTLLGLNLYGFEQQIDEVRENGRIVSLTSQANDDGRDQNVALTLQGGQLKGTYNGDARQDIDPKLATSLFWQEPAVGQTEVLDCLRGKVRDVTVTDLGLETLGLPAGKVQAHHYRVSGEMKRELWYDQNGILVAGQLKAKDGSTVRQELLQRP